MMSYTKSMDDEYLKRFIIWYGESLEEFYYDKTLPVGAAFFIAMGFHQIFYFKNIQTKYDYLSCQNST